ncbi:MAG: 50S ribosomal protein L22 [Deltaproteobacteria bacterium]|jgi:large subunit ribosomal protein L22|nr:50S ribosomal protein L22 [Deltaproteobacteria bacterium]MBW2483445.1 50S ribosomal protein L22 [Deltaproteobacteria bacterium]
MEVRAVSKYVRISPNKVRKLVDDIKGQPVESGLQKLKFMPQKGASILEKIIRSAVANADANADVDIDLLVIRNITADQGPTLKRWKARARGRGTRVLKRTSHITVILAEDSSA